MPPGSARARSRRRRATASSASIDYALVNDDLALLWAVNMGCIDMNAWTSRATRPSGLTG